MCDAALSRSRIKACRWWNGGFRCPQRSQEEAALLGRENDSCAVVTGRQVMTHTNKKCVFLRSELQIICL